MRIDKDDDFSVTQEASELKDLDENSEAYRQVVKRIERMKSANWRSIANQILEAKKIPDRQ